MKLEEQLLLLRDLLRVDGQPTTSVASPSKAMRRRQRKWKQELRFQRSRESLLAWRPPALESLKPRHLHHSGSHGAPVEAAVRVVSADALHTDASFEHGMARTLHMKMTVTEEQARAEEMIWDLHEQKHLLEFQLAHALERLEQVEASIRKDSNVTVLSLSRLLGLEAEAMPAEALNEEVKAQSAETQKVAAKAKTAEVPYNEVTSTVESSQCTRSVGSEGVVLDAMITVEGHEDHEEEDHATSQPVSAKGIAARDSPTDDDSGDRHSVTMADVHDYGQLAADIPVSSSDDDIIDDQCITLRASSADLDDLIAESLEQVAIALDKDNCKLSSFLF